jgi:hypothetical protein
VADSPLADELGGQECEQRLQRRDLLGAGKLCIGDGLRQVKVQQQGKKEKKTGHLGRELPPVVEDQPADIGNVWYNGTILRVLARLRVRATVSPHGQPVALQEAEEVRFADVDSLLFQGGSDVGQAGSLAAKRASPLADRGAFWGDLGPRPSSGEDQVNVGVASEIADNGSNGSDMKMKPLGDVIGGCGFVEVSATDLVASLSR